MVLHHPATNPAVRVLRVFGIGAAWMAAMVAGTALLMGLFMGHDDSRLVGTNGQPITMAEVVMQSATERALVSPATAVLAGNNESNERRGL